MFSVILTLILIFFHSPLRPDRMLQIVNQLSCKLRRKTMGGAPVFDRLPCAEWTGETVQIVGGEDIRSIGIDEQEIKDFGSSVNPQAGRREFFPWRQMEN